MSACQIFTQSKSFLTKIVQKNVNYSQYQQLVNFLLKKFESDRCRVFSNMKRSAMALNMQLQRSGIRSTDFHSDISQGKRTSLLRSFREGHLNVLVATDVAARGIDIPEINLILHRKNSSALLKYTNIECIKV